MRFMANNPEYPDAVRELIEIAELNCAFAERLTGRGKHDFDVSRRREEARRAELVVIEPRE